jgi:hypothetical protein
LKLRDIPTAARVELLEPLSQRPSRRYLLQKATFVTQSFFNRLTQSGRPWAVCDQPIMLTVAPGQSEYVLPVGNEWGRVLDVVTCDPSNLSFIERQVNFTELADQKFDWNLPRNYQGHMDSAGHTAQRLSFYKKGFANDQYVSVWPIPVQSSTYKIIYSLGNWASDMSLDDSPLLTQHHALLVCKTALDSVTSAAWWDDEKENRIRRKELTDSLSAQLPVYLRQFDEFVRNATQPRMTQRLTYAID